MISRITVILGLCTSLAAAQPTWQWDYINSVVAACELRYRVVRESLNHRVVRESLAVDTVVIGTATLVCDDKFTYAVTARHVVRGLDSVFLRFPLENGKFELAKIGGALPYNFIFPQDTMLDVSLSVVVTPKASVAKAFSASTCAQTSDLYPGRELKVVGFPVSVRVPDDVPFVKLGVVSTQPDTEGNYYIDSNVFPGNSGGAVIIPPGPEILNPTGKWPKYPRLAGIVVGYLAYQDVAISQQTKRTRVVFEENSGITQVVTPQALLRFLQNRK
jgi:hypothetical protein